MTGMDNWDCWENDSAYGSDQDRDSDDQSDPQLKSVESSATAAKWQAGAMEVYNSTIAKGTEELIAHLPDTIPERASMKRGLEICTNLNTGLTSAIAGAEDGSVEAEAFRKRYVRSHFEPGPLLYA